MFVPFRSLFHGFLQCVASYASEPNKEHRLQSRRLAALAGILCLLATPAALSARTRNVTWRVNTTADSNDGTDACGNGLSVCSLRDALTLANSGDRIEFNLDPGTITLGSALPAIAGKLTIEGPGASQLTISGGNAYQVFLIERAATVKISDLTIANGFSGVGLPNPSSGGAIYNDGSLNVTDTVFSHNSTGGSSSGPGGAIYNNGSLAVWDSSFYSNSAIGVNRGEGGAVYTASGAETVISNSTFSGNRATGQNRNAGGGAICNAGGATEIIDSTFSANGSIASTVANGGAIVSHVNDQGTGSAALDVVNSTFTGNWANQYGGAVYVENGTLSMANTAISGNFLGTSRAVSQYDDLDDATGHTTFSGGTGNVIGYYNAPSSRAPSPAIGLLPLGIYGGPTQTMLPQPGSPVICAGSSSNLPRHVRTDQRYWPIARSCVDAGAVQSNYALINTLADTLNSTDTSSCTDGTETATNTCSLRDLLAQTQPDGKGKVGSDSRVDAAFTPSLFVNGAAPLPGTITLGAGGTDASLPQITASLNLIGPGANLLTISGNLDTNVGSIFTVGDDATVAIDGVTLAHGSVTGPINEHGGAAIASTGAVTLENDAITGNQAVGINGGALLSTGSIVILNSTLTGNTTTNRGAALFNAGYGNATVVNSTFTGNQAADGGGIENFASLAVYNSTISGNTVTGVGGGIDQSPSNGGPPVLYNTIVAGNSTAGVTTAGDCNNCGDQAPYNLIGLPNGDTSFNQILGTPAYSPVAASLQTMMPLPSQPRPELTAGSESLNSPPIARGLLCAGNASRLPAGITTDERGFPMDPDCSAGTVDLGAVQTNFTTFQTVGYTGIATLPISPSPTAEVWETNGLTATADGVGGVPVTLTLDGPGTLSGASTVTTTPVTINNVTDNLAVYAGLSISSPGSGDSFTPSFAGYTPSNNLNAGAFNIVADMPALQLSSNLNPALSGGSMIFTATVLPPSGGPLNAPTPAGTITFSANGNALCTAVAIANGSASCMASFVTAGTEQVVATFTSSNDSYLGATSNTVDEIVATVSLNLPSTSIHVIPGGNGTFSITISPVGTATFLQSVTLSITGLPAGYTAAFSPSATIAAGSPATTIQITIQAPLVARAQPEHAPGQGGTGLGTWSLALLLLPFAGLRRAGRKMRNGIALLVLAAASLAGSIALMGCGSASYSPSSFQTFNFTLTATSGTTSTSTVVTVTIP